MVTVAAYLVAVLVVAPLSGALVSFLFFLPDAIIIRRWPDAVSLRRIVELFDGSAVGFAMAWASFGVFHFFSVEFTWTAIIAVAGLSVLNSARRARNALVIFTSLGAMHGATARTVDRNQVLADPVWRESYLGVGTEITRAIGEILGLIIGGAIIHSP